MRNIPYAWRQAVQQAIVERDQNQRERKIQEAELAIFARIDTFSPEDSHEEVELYEALRKLRALRQLVEH
jgi:hypothetical protein